MPNIYPTFPRRGKMGKSKVLAKARPFSGRTRPILPAKASPKARAAVAKVRPSTRKR